MQDDEKKHEGTDIPMYDPYSPMPGDYGMDPAFAESGSVVARSGAPLEQNGTPVASVEQVGEALTGVYDPEIPVDIYKLGLIYNIDIASDGTTKIDMTLTSPGCPVAGILPQQVADAAAGVAGVGEVEITLVWDPPWNPDMMSEEAKVALGMF